ncbi:MAG: L-serine ammonia-lyase, iron-sulfur-dependent subunit beta [Vampirovibrionia bacterium]
MKYISLFDIIGPTMVGPSSSHTAGAIRIGNIAREILGETPQKVNFTLYNSFAKTGKGHGTDKGLLGGVLGFNVSDSRIKDAYSIAQNDGVEFSFEYKTSSSRHSNAVDIELVGNETVYVSGNSVGAGEIEITQIDGFKVSLQGDLPTIIVLYKDQPGMISKITNLIQKEEINIASLHCDRQAKGDVAFVSICLDVVVPERVIASIAEIKKVYLVKSIDSIER